MSSQPDWRRRFLAYRRTRSCRPLFLCGAALDVLARLPDHSIDCCLTSPPYWGQRQYASGGLGEELDWADYVTHVVHVGSELARVLKPAGSFWLNLGDTYRGKRLLGIPWRVALALGDEGGWLLRNDVIWNKVKGAPDTARDKLRNVHEHVFHFVRQPRFYYDIDAIRSGPRPAQVRNGAVVSATGVSGVRYRRQIELSTSLTDDERRSALAALDSLLQQVAEGRLSDFRMIIRGQQRTTHSDSERLSGRARELRERGFYFLKYHPRGSKPADVWDILPEDSQNRREHFAPYPADLCRLPLLATCPPDGIVLDPFCGTGTTCAVARSLGRKSVGIDIAAEYLRLARARCR